MHIFCIDNYFHYHHGFIEKNKSDAFYSAEHFISVRRKYVFMGLFDKDKTAEWGTACI